MYGEFVGKVRAAGIGVALLATCACQPRIGRPKPPAERTHPGDEFVSVQVVVSGRGEVEAADFAGWCKKRCSYRVARGTRIRFRAEAREDFFSGWTGACGFSPECTFAPNGDVTLRAQFERDRREFEWARVLAADDCIGVDGLSAEADLVLLGHMREHADLDGVKLNGAGSNDVLVAAVDPQSAKVRWAHLIGGPKGEMPHLLHPASVDVMVASIWAPSVKHGGPGSSINWISARNGSVLRSVPIADLMHNLRMLPDEDLVGISSPRLWRGPSNVTRTDIQGKVRWSTTLEATKQLFVHELVIDGPETIVVGSLKGDPRFGGRAWTGSRRAGSWSDFFLARLHLTDGQLLESHWLFSGERFEGIGGLAVEKRDVLFALNTMGTTRFLGQELTSSDSRLWIVSVSADLDHINWAQGFRTDSPNWEVNFRPFRGGVVVAGRGYRRIDVGSRTIGGSSSKGTMFVAELDRTGRVVWADGAEVGGGHEAPALSIDSADNIYVAGPLDVRTKVGAFDLQPRGRGRCDTVYLAKIRRRR